MNSVDVCLTHQQLENYQHHDKNVVVIDVLRATSTINTILFSGAKSVKPVESLEECMKLKEDGYIVMAERMGKKVEGFDYGNCLLYTSPSPRDTALSRMPSSA